MTIQQRVLVFCGFAIISIVYSAWMTGGTFAFREADLFPNYNMLAKSFARGQLSIDEVPPEDYSLWDGKRYLYFGPVPALIRLPVMLVFGRVVPSGLMIVLFCAGCAVLFALIMSELTLVEDTSDTLLKVIFGLLFVFNGYSLLMTEIPTIHHEAIAAAMFFLLSAVYLLARARKQGRVPSLATSVLLGLSLACSVGSRATYLFSCAIIAAAFIACVWFMPGEVAWRKKIVPLAATIGITLAGGYLLLAFNYARFSDPFEFGLKYQMSTYREYLLAGNFLRYEHVPYNLWSMFFRLPFLLPEFPYLVMPRFVLETRSIEFMPYHVLYANELSVSVFVLMPVLILSAIPLVLFREGSPKMEPYAILVLFALVITQLFPLVPSMSTVARYYYDFVPIMIMMSYLGGLWLKGKGSGYFLMVLLAAAFSVVISFTLPMNAIKFYLEN